MHANARATLWRWLAGAAALALLAGVEFALTLFSVYGSVGAAIAFFATPVVFAVRTPRSWLFLAGIAALLSLVTSSSIAELVLRPSNASVARACCDNGQWYDIVPLTGMQVALTCMFIGGGLFVGALAAFALWKRAAIEGSGNATATA